ncbi:MAG: hypothetical protein NVSMB66_6030 [Candidatus Doudnabacteria bacterium]
MSTTFAKKAFAVASSSALVLASFASIASAAVHSAGTNVSINGTVYFIDPSGVKRGYTSGGAFLSYGYNSWSQVVPASAEDMALPTGSFVPPMDGSLINDMGTIYVINNGQRSGITTMAVFNGLGYNLSSVMAGDTSFMTSAPILSSSTQPHPTGALVNQSGTIYLITASGKMGIPTESVFNSWGYSYANSVPANAADVAVAMSSGIMQARVVGQLNPTGNNGGNVVVTPTSGPLSVSASSDMPASGTIVAGQATADLGHFTFFGNGTLNNVTFQRLGVSSNTTLNNVYLYNGATRVADGASVNQNGAITFGGLNLPVNGSLALAVKADINSAATGQTVGVQLTSFTVSNGNPVTVSISGNLMSVANTTLAGVSVQANTIGSSSVNAGTTGFSFWSSPVTVNTRAVLLKGATFKYISSATNDSVANFHLYLNGSPVGGNGVINSLNNLTFDLSGSPVTLNTGSSTLEVRGDIVKGSNRNIQLSLLNAADLIVADSQIGVNVAVVSPLTGSTSFSAIAGGTISVNAGSVTTSIDPSFNAVTNVTGGATGATIGRFKLMSYGEDVKIMNLSVTPVLSGAMAPAAAGLNNVSLFLNGSQVGSSQNWTAGALTFNLGSSAIVPAGTAATLEVRADLQTSANANYTAGTVSVTVNAGTNNGQGLSSLATVSVPAASITTNGLLITTGALSIAAAPAYAAQTVNGNQANVKIGSYVLQNTSSSEGVRVTNLAVALSFVAPNYQSGAVTVGSQAIVFNSTAGMTVGNTITIPGATPAVGTVTAVTNGTTAQVNITTGGVTPTVGGAVTGSGSTVGPAVLTNITNLRTSEPSGSGTNPINPAANNNFSVNFTLAPGATKQIDILADIGTANFGSVTTTLLPSAIGVSSNVVLTPSSVTTGQVITLSAGTLSAPVLNSVSVGGTLAAQFVVGGSSPVLAQYNFIASNGNANITELKFAVTGTGNPVTQVCVSGQCAPVVSGTAYITGLNIAVPNNNAGVNVNVTPTFAAVGTNGVASNTTVQLTLSYVKSTIGGVTTITTPAVASNVMTIVGTKPTVTVNASTDTLVNGLVRLADFAIAADPAGDIKVQTLNVSVSSTGSAAVTTAANNIVVKDSNGVVIPTTNPGLAVVAGSTGSDTVTFAGSGFLIPAGTTKVFSVYTTPSGVTGATGTTSLSTKAGAAASFTFTDQVGGVANITGAQIYNYPTNTSVIRN